MLLMLLSNVNIITCITTFYINSNKYFVNLLSDLRITSLLSPTIRIMITLRSCKHYLSCIFLILTSTNTIFGNFYISKMENRKTCSTQDTSDTLILCRHWVSCNLTEFGYSVQNSVQDCFQSQMLRANIGSSGTQTSVQQGHILGVPMADLPQAQ